eukprot:390439_1
MRKKEMNSIHAQKKYSIYYDIVINMVQRQKKKSYSPFKVIDTALGQYYLDCGRSDYYDKYGRGKFIKFTLDNGLDERDIDTALGVNAVPEDCVFIDMDNEFPLFDEHKENETDLRRIACFDILRYCYKCSIPPCRNSIERLLKLPHPIMVENETFILQWENIENAIKLRCFVCIQ